MEELVKQARKGDDKAFEQLIKSIQLDLYRIAHLRLSNEEDILDAVQVSIIEIFVNIRKLRDVRSFKSWAIKILINECNTIYRKNQRYEVEEYDEKVDKSYSSSIDDKLSEYSFDDLLKGLKYEEKLILTLFYKNDLTTKQISKILDEKEATIRTRLARARNKIKNDLMEGGYLYE